MVKTPIAAMDMLEKIKEATERATETSTTQKQKTELNEEGIVETAIAAMDMVEKLKKQMKEQPGTSRQSEKLKNYALTIAGYSYEILDHS